MAPLGATRVRPLAGISFRGSRGAEVIQNNDPELEFNFTRNTLSCDPTFSKHDRLIASFGRNHWTFLPIQIETSKRDVIDVCFRADYLFRRFHSPA